MKFTEIGVVLKPQGVKGQIKVRPYDADFFVGLKETNGYKVRACVVRHDGFAYVDLDGIDTVEKAEKLRDVVLKAEVKLQDDEFLTEDIVGFAVVSKRGKNLGRLLSVNNYGSTDVFDCGRFSFPFVDEFVVKIDTQKRQIVVNEEMLEEEVVL